jgi:hypothetical protein
LEYVIIEKKTHKRQLSKLSIDHFVNCHSYMIKGPQLRLKAILPRMAPKTLRELINKSYFDNKTKTGLIQESRHISDVTSHYTIVKNPVISLVTFSSCDVMIKFDT